MMAMASRGGKVGLAAAVVVIAMIAVAAAAAEAAGDGGRPQVSSPCQQSEAYPFCDTRLSIHDRVHDLVSRFTLEEKAKLLVNKNPEISRLGLPAYEWWQEGLHGVAYSPGVSFGSGRVNGATSFPQPILTAASFNRNLFNRIGQVISTEARAMHNENQAGLTYWAPNINIFRDPRWGRGQETPGEDPLLTSTYAEYFVRGMQEDGDYYNLGDHRNSNGKGPENLKVSACCKHFTAYDIDEWYGVQRYDFNAKVTKQDLLDTYNPPFQSCVEEGKASSIMCSYNRVNDIPTCADYNYLTKLVRGTWRFDGYIVTDCDALQVMYANSKYAESPESAVAYGLKAGLDMNCGDTASNFTMQAVQKGILDESDIDKSLHNSFMVLFRLGHFDGNPQNDPKYGKLDENNICTQEHQDLALQAAVQGIVLLKNDHNTLPLSPHNVRKIAVLGPNANDGIRTMLGNYAGEPCNYITPFDAMASYIENANYHPGCVNGTSCDGSDGSDYIKKAAEIAAQADAVVLVMGLSQDQEREAYDRITLRLPGRQEELIKTVSKVAKGPVVLVLMTGGPVDISFVKNDPMIKSILWVGYPGQAGGKALAQIIFGDSNPGGKLPMSWYPESYTKVPMTDMNMRPDESRGYPGRTYRFYTGDVIYNFGHGMSYTRFSLSFDTGGAPSVVRVAATRGQSWCSQMHAGNNNTDIEISVSVKNEGEVFGTNVVLLYHAAPTPGTGGNEIRHLVGFERVDLASMEQRRIAFKVDLCRQLSVATLEGRWNDPTDGVHTFSLGNSDDGVTHDVQLLFQRK